MRLLVGTSGFAYREWKGHFYPPDLRNAAMLRYYAERFPSVEINNTFYRMPSENVLEQWSAEVGPDFRFVLKAPQTITHRRRLKQVDDAVAHFFRVADTLGDRFGPVLVQLPPNLKVDAERLEAFLALAPTGARLAFEFRHDSWFDPGVYAALRARGAVLCAAHTEAGATPLIATSSWGYIRLRNVEYDDAELDDWVARIRAQPWDEVYVFFKHEDEATGPRLAARFRERFDPASGSGVSDDVEPVQPDRSTDTPGQ